MSSTISSTQRTGPNSNILHQRLHLCLGTAVASEAAKSKEKAATIPTSLGKYIDGLAHHDFKCNKKLMKMNRMKSKQCRGKGSYMDDKLSEVN